MKSFSFSSGEAFIWIERKSQRSPAVELDNNNVGLVIGNKLPALRLCNLASLR